jgi:hypothetical protein
LSIITESQAIRPTYIQSTSTSPSTSPSTISETRYQSPNVSPTASQNITSFGSFIDLYNHITNELSDDTLSETNEDISVS